MDAFAPLQDLLSSHRPRTGTLTRDGERLAVLCQYDWESGTWCACFIGPDGLEREQWSGPLIRSEVLDELDDEGIVWTPVGEIAAFMDRWFPLAELESTVSSMPSSGLGAGRR